MEVYVLQKTIQETANDPLLWWIPLRNGRKIGTKP